MDHAILMILYIISCHLCLVMTHIMTASAAQILELRRENRLVKKWMGTDVEGASRALSYTWELSLNMPKLTHGQYPLMCPN